MKKYVNHYYSRSTNWKVQIHIRICSPYGPLRGPIYVGTESGFPEVHKLPFGQGYNWVTRPQRDINSGD
jgi:hypothetical protein